MRQAGSLAAAGSFALQHHIERLQTDHDNAKSIEKILSQLGYIKSIMPVETNIVIAECTDGFDVPSFVQKMKEAGVLFFAVSPTRFRMVTHLDFNEEMLNPLEKSLKNIN